MSGSEDLSDLLNKSTWKLFVEHIFIAASPVWIFLIVFAIGWYGENRELVSNILENINF